MLEIRPPTREEDIRFIRGEYFYLRERTAMGEADFDKSVNYLLKKMRQYPNVFPDEIAALKERRFL